MTSPANSHLVEFLREELSIAPSSIEMALRQSELDPGPLPMILWQYGLITLEQLERIYDWLDSI
jgi:hypothetical protein